MAAVSERTVAMSLEAVMEIRFGKLLAGAAMTALCAGLAVVPGSGVAYGADTRHCQISNQSE